MRSLENFYDDLSSYYHLMFENWDTSIEEQGKIISSLLPPPDSCGVVLDCSCGIGTQLIALKKLGYDIEGSDISNHEIIRLSQEATKRNLIINARVDDMRTLNTAPLSHYGTILAIGNSIPHLLTDQEIMTAFTSMKKRLQSGGMILVGVKDYKPLMFARTKTTEPRFLQDKHGKRIVHQIWDWQDERIHTVHLYITQQTNLDWVVKHSTVTYRAISLEEIKSLMQEAGLTDVSILYPETTSFYQPIVRGYK